MRFFLVDDDVHELVDALSAALDAKSACTHGHSERVAELSLLLAKHMGLPPEEQQRIHIGAHLHDIGKIGIPDAILDKPGKLSKREYDIIRQHPAIGSYIVGKVKVFHPVADIVRHHHERVDGRGYPDGLHSGEISLGARIVALADAVDAMLSLRSYRNPLSLPDMLREVRSCRGTQFDENVVDVLTKLVEKGLLHFLYVPGKVAVWK